MDDEDETQSNPVADQREQIKNLEKQLKAVQKEADSANAKAAAAETARRQDLATTHLKAAGLSEKVAGLYLSANPEADITPESVAAFASEYGLAPIQDQEAPEEAPQADAFVPVPGSPPNTQLDYKGFKELMKTDPNRAWAMAQQGMVEMPGVKIAHALDGSEVVEGSWG
jgi:hypothetical protein